MIAQHSQPSRRSFTVCAKGSPRWQDILTGSAGYQSSTVGNCPKSARGFRNSSYISRQCGQRQRRRRWSPSGRESMAKKILSPEEIQQIVDRATNGGKGDAAKFGDKNNAQEVFQKVQRFLGRFVCDPSEHAHVAHVLW